jgi:hypothetical protein
MRHRILLLLVAPCLVRSAAAQTDVALLGGSVATRGNARSDAGADQPELRPDHTGTLMLAVRRRFGAWRVGGAVRHTSADLAEVGSGTAVVTRGALRAWGAGIELGRRVAGTAGGADLLALAGAAFDRWRFVDLEGPARWRAALTGALEARLPAGRRWAALIRAEAMAGPSLFSSDELPAEFHRRAAWRYGVLVGLARRW